MRSLKYRIAGAVFMFEAVCLLLVLGYTFSSYWRQHLYRTNHEEQIILELVSGFGRDALRTGNFKAIQSQYAQIIDGHVLAIVLADINNRVVASTSPSIKTIPTLDDPGNPTTYWKKIDIQDGSGKSGTLAIHFSNATFVEGHNGVRNRAILIGVTGMFVISLVAITVGHLLTRRLDKVTQAAQRFARGENMGLKTNIKGNDEIARLAQTFDQMVEDKLHAQENLERQVQQRTAALLSSYKELEAFSYSVSHDLRAPLRSIDGFSQILVEDCGEQLDEEGKNYLQRIRAASQNMGRLIDDILLLSRVGRHDINPSQVDLSRQARTVVKQLSESSPGRSVDVTIEPGITVQADEMLMRIVLENLLGNAWKYTGKKDNARIEVGCLEDKTVYVRDNGAGFDMRYADKLFKPFHRLHSPSEFEGTGVGLATVKRIIEKHGGKVWCDGDVNEGAAFYFKL